MIAVTANANGVISIVPSFGLHTRLVSYGRISDRMNGLPNAIDHQYALLVVKISTKLVLLCICTCLMIFPTVVPTVGQGMVINQSLLYSTEFVPFASLVFNAENAVQIPFVCTWYANKSLALLRNELDLGNWSPLW